MNSRRLTAYSASLYLVWYMVNTLCVTGSPCAMQCLTAGACAGAALAALCVLCLMPPRAVDVLIPAMVIALGVFEGAYGFCQLMGWAFPGHPRYAMTGTFGNPGPYGGMMSVCAIMAFCTGKKYGRTWIMWAGVAMSAMAMVSMSRAAIVALGVAAGILWRRDCMRHLKWIAVPLALTAFALYLSKAGSAHGRVFMALMGVEAWKDALWQGHGTGAYMHAMSQAEARWFATHPDSLMAAWAGVAEYPFCEPLKIAVEHGVAGIVLFAGMIVSALVGLWRRRSPSFYGLFVLSVFSLFSYPFSLWSFLLLLCLFVAEAIVPLGAPARWKAISAGILGLLVMSVSLAGMTRYNKARSEYSRFAYVRNAAFIKDYYRLLPLMLEDRRFLFNFGQILRDAGRYNDSNDMLRQGAMVSNDPMFLVLQGNNYRDMGAYQLAEQAYLEAWHMMPGRIYPLYRLMKLYEQQGDQARMVEYAEAVAAFKEKVSSPAVADMKCEAMEIINISLFNE